VISSHQHCIWINLVFSFLAMNRTTKNSSSSNELLSVPLSSSILCRACQQLCISSLLALTTLNPKWNSCICNLLNLQTSMEVFPTLLSTFDMVYKLEANQTAIPATG
jgi:hypothetical protein